MRGWKLWLFTITVFFCGVTSTLIFVAKDRPRNTTATAEKSGDSGHDNPSPVAATNAETPNHGLSASSSHNDSGGSPTHDIPAPHAPSAPLQPGDIAKLQREQQQKTSAFLEKNNFIWQGNSDNGTSRADSKVLEAAVGTFFLEYSYIVPGADKEHQQRIELRVSRPPAGKNILEGKIAYFFRDEHGPSGSSTGSLGTFGTDDEALHLINNNPNGDETEFITYLAWKI